jgi:type I restriction enzyme S subunit
LDALDDRITLLRETNATLEAIAQALFKSWFVDFDPVRAKMEGRAPEGMDEATARLFPDSFEESELGLVPRGWQVGKFEDFIKRMSVGKKFDQKTANAIGTVPILDQGKSGVIGFHDEAPGVRASLDNPVVVFANHTCYMRLITFDFSAIQNVLPFVGLGVDTVWAFYATKDRVKFSEYKGHWPDFAIEKAVLPEASLTSAFRDVVDPLMRSVRTNDLQTLTLATLRDTLLPRLISGQLRLPEVGYEN